MYSIPKINEIKIYSLDFPTVSDKTFIHKDNLSPQEIEIANKYKCEKDKAQFIITRSFLRKLLGSFLSISPENVRINVNQFGKPIIDSKISECIKFNLSHSGDKIVYAFSLGYEVGIDIERLDISINHLEIAETYFTPEEFFYIKNSEDQSEITHRFFRIWTRKEAVLKAAGTGFLPDLKIIDVLQAVVKLNLSSNELPENLNKIFTVIDLSIHKNYKSALAYSGENKKIIIEQISC